MAFIDRYAREIRENKPIDYAGMTLHPLTVADFALYQSAKAAMELMLSSLPPAMARLSWFGALMALDAESRRLGGNADFAGSVLRLLAAALKLEPLTDPAGSGRQSYPMRLMFQQDGKLAGIQIGMTGGLLIAPKQMGQIREILAAQNGYELPDENWNTELVEAQRYTQARKNRGGEVKFDLEALVYSVALGAHVRAAEIWSWPLREFLQTEEAIDRAVNYQIYTLAEAGGNVRFKNGNPYPTWKLNRRPELPGDFQSVDELDAGAKGLLDDKTQHKE